MTLPVNEFVDTDVDIERSRIDTIPEEERRGGDLITIHDLTKVYASCWSCRGQSILAVNQMTVGITRGECFCLLGINGSGKTTTVKMLTAELEPTYGRAFIAGHDVTSESKQVHRNIGYCGELNALLDFLTCKQTLEMYARIAGIKEENIRVEVKRLLREIMMEDCANKLVKHLSVGYSRRLNAAVAVIGDPSVILLDEPTTGVDPLSRRYMWTFLHKHSIAGRTIFITSHSMEECEVLCGRLAILVDGSFRCLGTPKHLKKKFNAGYSLRLRAYDENPVVMETLKRLITTEFPRFSLVTEHQSQITYNMPSKTINWSTVFDQLEKAKAAKLIDVYSITQTSLDEIFFNITSNNPVQGSSQTSLYESNCNLNVESIYLRTPRIS